jgi:nitric oxide synthase oxygenase domain/subunit
MVCDLMISARAKFELKRPFRNTIELVDRRDCNTSEGMLEACFHHLRTARNGGRVKPTVTVFPQKLPGKEGPRVWGIQMLRYAGYVMPDGKIMGDSMNVEITNRCVELGWEPKYGKWDVLPLICMADGQEPVLREVPEDAKREVHITHPNYPWFAELGLRWCDHPPVTQFGLTVGGIDYTAVPFSGLLDVVF